MIKELRHQAGMAQKQFAEYFKIPVRTIEDWEAGRRKPPEYIIELIKYKLDKEGYLFMGKLLKDYTIEDVSKLVNMAYYKSSKSDKIYIQLDDRYSDNARAYLGVSDTHSGGGRITWGCVWYAQNVFAEMFSDKDDEFYSREKFCQRLYDYIQKNYH